jgi:hypothetical protein
MTDFQKIVVMIALHPYAAAGRDNARRIGVDRPRTVIHRIFRSARFFLYRSLAERVLDWANQNLGLDEPFSPQAQSSPRPGRCRRRLATASICLIFRHGASLPVNMFLF